MPVSTEHCCLSHLPLLSGYDDPRTLSYQIPLFGPMSADVRQGAGSCPSQSWHKITYLKDWFT